MSARDRPDLVTVKQAAQELQLTALTLRYFMAEGKVDLGLVMGESGGRRKFVIYREKLNAEKKRLGLM